MKKEVREKWVAALRSGDYNQGLERMVNEGGDYCCLGVLRQVCKLKPPHQPDELTTIQRDEVGLDVLEQSILINMNDGMGGLDYHSFSEIADWIEDNIEGEE